MGIGCSAPLSFSDPMTARELSPPLLTESTRVRFAVIGDIGHAGEAQRHLAHRVRRVCEHSSTRCDFMVANGDNLYPAGFDSNNAAAELRTLLDHYGSFPKYLVLGNHDNNPYLYDRDTGEAQLRFIRSTDGLHGDAHFWKMSAGPLQLIGVDTDYIIRGDGHSEDDKGLIEWLRGAIDSKAPFRIMLGHHPYLSNGKHGNAGQYFWNTGVHWKRLFERYVAGHAQLYISGHDHHLEFYTQSSSVPAARNTALAVVGASSKCRGRGDAENPEETGVAPAVERYGYGFAWIEVSKTRLLVRYHDMNGAVFFEAERGLETGWTVSKAVTDTVERCECEHLALKNDKPGRCGPENSR